MDLSPLLNMDPAHLFIAAGLFFVARTMRKVNHDVLTFFGNHLSDVVDTQERVAAALQKLCDKQDEVLRRVECYGRLEPNRADAQGPG